MSKEYRVNRNSVLNQLRFFHVCDGSLLPDIMHDVLEGTLQYEAKLMLQVMVNKEEYFTLEELNSRIENFELGYMESKNRPTAISSTTLFLNGNSLKQNGMCLFQVILLYIYYLASQMNLFGHILPLLIGDLVPDDDECYELFLKLMDITDILFSPTTSDDYSAYLATLIREHHHEFCRVYPDHNIIPKMHFMVHTPRLMTQ